MLKYAAILPVATVIGGLSVTAQAPGSAPVPASRIIAEFKADRATAVKQWSDKVVIVVGRVARINVHDGKFYNLLLEADTVDDGFLAHLDPNLETLPFKVGDTVSLRCKMDPVNAAGECQLN